MTSEGLELRHATDIEAVWNTLIEVYAEVRADQLHQPHYSVERYGERLTRHGAEPGWEAVTAGGAGWPRLREGTTDRATVALKEIMLRVPWRGTGTARRRSRSHRNAARHPRARVRVGLGGAVRRRRAAPVIAQQTVVNARAQQAAAAGDRLRLPSGRSLRRTNA
ncbi:hypothetical protein LHJ74_15090 [Streptomyces sp. N2-109]|uniref:Uncharacterized protein n=1 Tax=Streptomyces gossypii TaxID=2883101 RepID=A0ABT2JTJ8_9ACTN|nr:hypothetical protein [Streptomyces gossypii]MCT2591216.1 hypothetical protein [Streptomyces gossypii]